MARTHNREGETTEPPDHGPLTHGFLFADLRGYTSYAESRGDAAAADLLDRYRVIVRAVVGELGGAEIKTEGDSFYVVFPSASRAVAAGLAIVGRAAEASAAQPAEPIRVGVGIHAGEAEQRAEGYVGTAVNIAARVCGQARPGEVLVTETVRSLTRTSGRYRFTPRGHPSLKGISEPIGLFAAQDASSEASRPSLISVPRSSRSPAAADRGIGLIAIAGVAMISVGTVVSGALGPGRGTGSSPSPGPVSSGLATSSSASAVGLASAATPPGPSGPRPFHTGLLAAGTYVSNLMDPPIRFTVPEGWNGIEELPNYIELQPFTDESSQLVFLTPSVAYAPCSLTDFETLPTGREDLVAWLKADKGLSVEVVGSLEVGQRRGRAARRRSR